MIVLMDQVKQHLNHNCTHLDRIGNHILILAIILVKHLIHLMMGLVRQMKDPIQVVQLVPHLLELCHLHQVLQLLLGRMSIYLFHGFVN